MAELGTPQAMVNELQKMMLDGEVGEIVMSLDRVASNAACQVQIQASEMYPMLTCASMITPSPDFFTGVNSLDLRTEGSDTLAKTTKAVLEAYDSGTDAGAT